MSRNDDASVDKFPPEHNQYHNQLFHVILENSCCLWFCDNLESSFGGSMTMASVFLALIND